MERRYIDAAGVMQRTGLGRNTVYDLFKISGFPAVRIGRRIIVAEDDLYAWLDAQRVDQKRQEGT